MPSVAASTHFHVLVATGFTIRQSNVGGWPGKGLSRCKRLGPCRIGCRRVAAICGMDHFRYNPDRDRLSKKQPRPITNEAAGAIRRSRQHGCLAIRGARAAARERAPHHNCFDLGRDCRVR
jgi:hypothetical protein